MQKKLFIGNIPFTVKEEDLKTKLEEFGVVEELKLIKDRDTGRSKGFGFVTFATQAEAEKAISGLNNVEYDGRKLRVNMADDKPRREHRGGGHDRGGNRGGSRGGYGRDRE